MSDNLKFNFNNRSEDGYYVECTRCKGHGKDFGPDKDKKCWACGGKGTYFYPYRCHYNINNECSKYKCNMWDHDNGGGCLERKLVIKQIYGMVIK